MKKDILFLIPILFLSWTVRAQSDTSATEKKVYQAEDRLYVNKDLGVYLWISTSPDPNAEKVRLRSETSGEFSNPMYFDTEGYNTVRSPSAVDPETKAVMSPQQDIIFEVYADGRAPKSTSKYSYDGTQVINGKRYYSGDVSITIKSFDEVSGVDVLNCSLNSETYTIYKDPLTRVREGENTLRYFAVDKVGNQEAAKEEKFFIDKTPPKTSYEIQGEQNEQFVSVNANIILSSEDALSGVKNIYYRINNGKFYPYSTPVPARLLVDENATISFYAVDKLGNKEPVQFIGSKQGLRVDDNEKPQEVIFEFYVDSEAPEVTIEIETIGDLFEGKYQYVSPRTNFKIKADDEKSGVKEIRYGINTSKNTELFQKPFTLKNEGLQYVQASASDYVGNISAQLVKPFFNDVQAPNSVISIGSPKYALRDTLFITSKTMITLKTADIHSGIGSLRYSLGDGEFTVYEKPFCIEDDGFRTLNYYATDNVNNTEEKKNEILFVDNDPPKIHYHFSVESIGSKVVRDDNYTIYPTNTMLYIAATDARAGGEKIEYKINEGPVVSANPVKGLNPGNYLIRVFAYDVLGNKSTEEIKFSIEE